MLDIMEMHIEPLFWAGMGAIGLLICLMQAVCWTRTPNACRHG